MFVSHHICADYQPELVQHNRSIQLDDMRMLKHLEILNLALNSIGHPGDRKSEKSQETQKSSPLCRRDLLLADELHSDSMASEDMFGHYVSTKQISSSSRDI